jgi:5-methylcytosine-specific restriction endonuclease McrA
MSNIIHTELEETYQSIFKKKNSIDINNEATNYQIEIIQKMIALNMNDIEISAFFYNYIISFKSNYFYVKPGSIIEFTTFKYCSDFIEVISKLINRLAGKSTKMLTPYKIIDNNREQFLNELNIYITTQIELYNKTLKKSSKRMTINNKFDSPITIIEKVEIPDAPKKIGIKKINKDEIEPKKLIFTEEPKKKELSSYNVFYKEQIVLLQDNADIPNKMVHIAKLWNEYKMNNEIKTKNYIEPKQLFTTEIPNAPKKTAIIREKSDIEPKQLFTTEIPNAPKKTVIIREKSDIEPKQLFTDNIDISLKKTTKKQIISAAMRKLVWNMNIGEEIGKSKCLCCKVTYITQMSFHCGHIIAESQGGETIVSNLRPICQNCNSSMATKNMDDFMKTLK